MTKTARKLSRERGQAMLEFIVSAFVLFMVIFWVIQLIILLYTYNVMSQAAKEGVRYAVVHGSGLDIANASGPSTPANSDPSGDNIKNRVKNYAGFLSSSNITVNYLDGNNDAPSRVQVLVSYQMSSFVFGWVTAPTLTAAAQGRIFY
jgi:Flp pilus assembly protein TadG